MCGGFKSKLKKMAGAVLILFVAESVGVAAAAVNIADLELGAAAKHEVGYGEGDVTSRGRRKPNVLFLIDTTIPMTMSPKSVMPRIISKNGIMNDVFRRNDYADWDKTRSDQSYQFTFGDIVSFMGKATFGAGTLPTTNSKVTGGIGGDNNYYGRDVDDANNYKETVSDPARDMEKYKDSYYFPFAGDGGAIRDAFSEQKELYGWSGYPKNGTGPYPYALVFKDPKHWQGWKGSGVPAKDDLVPNDSRIYQLKLVLWRMLTERKWFDGIRFGLATTFGSPMAGADLNYVRHYKMAPFGSDVRSTGNSGKPFSNGTFDHAITGHRMDQSNMNLMRYAGWAADAAVLPFDSSDGLMGRGYLRLPIADYGYRWTRGGVTIDHARKFKLWMDGVNDIGSDWSGSGGSQFYYHRNPELMPVGINQASFALFPTERNQYGNLDRNNFIAWQWIWYSKKNTNASYAAGGNTRPTARYIGGSGEAAGSAIDFFSPPVSGSQYYRDMAKEMDDVSFPIRDVCEDNWVILITQGSELTQSYAHPMKNAAKSLYEYTRDNYVALAEFDASNGNTRTLRDARLNNPIRTLVIGMVTSTDKVTETAAKNEVIRLRRNIGRIAGAGQGYGTDNVNPPVPVYFADDVPSLAKALEDAITYITLKQDNPKGSPAFETPIVEEPDGAGGSSLYSSSYAVRDDDQWSGKLTRYDTKIGKKGDVSVIKAWELGDTLKARRGNRKLQFWKNGALRDVGSSLDDFRRLTGMDSKIMSASNIPGGSFGAVEPHKALYRWFQGYDYSYARSGREFPRENMLADLARSGTVMVSDPEPADSLPGFQEWAAGIKSNPQKQPPMLYAQGNDGVLHVIDPADGSEKIGMLPPPVLLPMRLASLKTTPADSGKFLWADVLSEKSAGKYGEKSNPVYLLDGPLQRKYINLDGMGKANGWGKYLIGTVGRAGNGIFMYDVSSHGSPKFMWYRENLPEGFIAMDAPDGEPKIKTPDANEKPYLKLGLNNPAPAVGVIVPPPGSGAKMTPFIALSGGVRNGVPDTSQNGGEGAVLMMINPSDGSVIKAFDSASVKAGMRVGWGETGTAPYMGMMTSPPSLVRSEAGKYYTGHLFTADNRGNIFRVSFEENIAGTVSPLPPLKWEIETVATLQDAASASKSGASYAIPHGVVSAFMKDGLWLAGGTADVPVKRGSQGNSFLQNAGQFIFAFKVSHGQASPMYRDRDWKKLVTSSADPAAPDMSLLPGDNQDGWYIKLEENRTFSEYVSANPVIANGMLFVPTFVRKYFDPGNPGLCASRSASGTSRIYSLDLSTGAAGMWAGGKKYIEIDGIKITGITKSGQGGSERLFLTYDKLDDKNGLGSIGDGNIEYINSAGLGILNIRLASGGGKANITSGDSVIMYWRISKDA